MGWTSYHAQFYKNGKVDRKKELDFEFGRDDSFRILKSSMVGSTYYAAVAHGMEVFAVIALTSTDSNDYYNFSYKEMDETEGPYKYDCPISILTMLSPTDNECALRWRENCVRYRNKSGRLRKLPIGTVIEIGNGSRMMRLTKYAGRLPYSEPYWSSDFGCHYIPIRYIPVDFRVVGKDE